jgi:hypothetical protein
MDALHVCFRGKSDTNCGECEKCLRTLLWLELSGRAGACRTFPRESIDLGMVERIYVRPWLRPYYEALREAARSSGRDDVVRAVDRCLRRSTMRRRAERLSDRLRDRRVLWRVSRPLRRAALAGAVL